MIYSEEGVFAGWPANHGLWQWDNEILVGFVRGKYNKGGLHNVLGDLEFVQARSLDYGVTWDMETTGIPEKFKNADCDDYYGDVSKDIFRVRGCYDHGGDYLEQEGGFWASSNRGVTWDGPYKFNGLRFGYNKENSSRTCVKGNTFYMSRRSIYDWSSDTVSSVVYDDGKFKTESTLNLGYRTVMPSVVDFNGQTVMAVRVKNHNGTGSNGIEIFVKNADKWKSVKVIDTGDTNGNPPALIVKNTLLFCVYGHRKNRKIVCEYAKDITDWGRCTIVDTNGSDDFGYCQLFDAGENDVGVIYYEDNDKDRSEIKLEIFEV